jgi:hypothetical protein
MPIGRINGPVADGTILDLLEPGWRRELAAGVPVGRLDVEPGVARAVAAALGEQSRSLPPGGAAERWPACVIVALARVAATADAGSLWPAWHRAAGLRQGRRSAGEWGSAFLAALGTLGLPAAGSAADDAVLAHVAAPSREAEGDNLDERERGDVAGEAGGSAGLRLDLFGGGVLRVDTASGQARPVLPAEAVLSQNVSRHGDRLLVFDADGALAGRLLPAEAVWAIYPVTAELRSDVPLRTVVTSTLPLTWRGWRLVQVDLREASWLALRDAEARARAYGERRAVRGRTRPVLRTGPPVPGVTTTAGKAVFARLPEVLLPSGQDRWRVEARRARSGAVLASVTASGDDWRPDALWQNVPRPVLGEFTITVTTGTVTPGLRRGVVLAEGLGVTSYPAPRLTSARGLESAEAVISAPSGMTVSPAAAEYQEATVTRQITCVAGPVVQHLAVTPPHIRLRVEPEPGGGGTATRWHHAGPLRLTSADLWRGGALRIDLPGVAVPPPVTVIARCSTESGSAETGKGPVQVLNPTRDGRYPLRRILDTVTVHGHAELTITIATAPVTIATVSGSSQVNDPWAMA